jgi:predicted Zn-ribbon and HTH transcriptional regulator
MQKRAGANILIQGHKCYRCDHEWIPRNKEPPETCPKCKSPFWQKPRKNHIGKK